MSLLSVYCGRLRAGEPGASGEAAPPSPFTHSVAWAYRPLRLHGSTRGLLYPRDAEGQLVRVATWPGCRQVWAPASTLIYRDTELHDSPSPFPRSLAFLAKTRRTLKGNCRPSVLAKLLCLSVSVYRARTSPGSVSKASPAFCKQWKR